MKRLLCWACVTLALPSLLPAQEPRQAGGKAKSAPKEVMVDLGKGIKLEIVLIPAGEFMMGSPDSDKLAFGVEKPQHRVRITKPFYLGKYLVTQEQWEAVTGSNPSHFKGPKNPVEQVTWDDCQEFIKKLNERVRRPNPNPFRGTHKVGRGEGEFRLPTEAQWEYACRAGSKTRYCFGDDESGLGEYAWYDKNSGDKTHPEGEKKPNAWGLYDMHGNVWEWCQDWWKDGYYKESPVDDPTGPPQGSSRVNRGGSWSYPANDCRSASRYGGAPGLTPSIWACVSLKFCRTSEHRKIAANNARRQSSLRESPSATTMRPVGRTKRRCIMKRLLWLVFVSVAVPSLLSAQEAKKPSDIKQITNSIGMKLTLVPSGEFVMGSSAEETAAFFNKTYGEDLLKTDFFKDEHPQHRVRIAKPFYLGTYHVTRGQFRQFVADAGYKTDAEKGRKPGVGMGP